MPTIKEMQLPKPANWQDFETIVVDAYSQRWKSTTLQKNGRSGQKQHGVDIYGHDDIGRPIGIQCKRFQGAFTLDVIEKEVIAAEKFKGQLVTLFVATTVDYDGPLQEKVRLLSDKRVASGKFAIALIFWGDVVSGLCLNPAVFKAHYPQVTLPLSSEVDRERLVAALEAGYYGADLWSYVCLVFGEVGQMANADPDELYATLPAIERRVLQLLAPADAEPIIESLREIRTGCEAPKRRKSDWDPVEDHAKRVQSKRAAIPPLNALA
ncbi:hypothetical protein ASE11_18585 [Hydrogenophaga sp. Root209]|nr:hypothetical protein ASE11_18585 [Hydrogenophaga sp. Root209]